MAPDRQLSVTHPKMVVKHLLPVLLLLLGACKPPPSCLFCLFGGCSSPPSATLDKTPSREKQDANPCELSSSLFFPSCYTLLFFSHTPATRRACASIPLRVSAGLCHSTIARSITGVACPSGIQFLCQPHMRKNTVMIPACTGFGSKSRLGEALGELSTLQQV